MIFSFAQGDDGSSIRFWLVPDNPSKPSSVYIVVNGRERHLIDANVFRPDVMSHGLQTTGQCGFLVDQALCPSLSADAEVEVFEADTNTLIYRRPHPDFAPCKIFHLETETQPLWGLARSLSLKTQMPYCYSEYIPEETIITLLGISFSDSLLLSGAVFYRRYEPYIRSSNFMKMILLVDPYRELASRLIQLKELARLGGATSAWKSLGRPTLVKELDAVDIRDAGQLDRMFRNMSVDNIHLLSNPTTRLLVANNAGEFVQEHMFPVALGILGDFELVGTDAEIETFNWQLEAITGIKDFRREADGAVPDLAAVHEAVLDSKMARQLVQIDAILRDAFSEAASRAVEKGAPGHLVQ